MEYFAGLDLGQASDPSALAIIEQHADRAYDPRDVHTITTTVTHREPWGGWDRGNVAHSTRQVLRLPDGTTTDVPSDGEPRYDVRHLDRYPLGTSYPAIVESVVDLMRRPPLNGEAPLVIDGTGVGRPVVDLFRAHPRADFPIVAVVITGGNVVTSEGGYVHVPKRELVSTLQVLMQATPRRLRYPPAAKMKLVDVLLAELGGFQYKISDRGHDSYGAWREGAHDDLLLALALCAWYAERNTWGSLR